MRELERDRSRSNGQPPRPAPLPSIVVIGPGNAGRSIARAAADAGLDVRPAGRVDALEACRGAEVALLCVPDAAIDEAAGSLAAAIPPLRYVGHTIGSRGLDALAAAAARGAETFSAHPLQTLPDPGSDLAGAACAIAGSSAAALALAESLAEALGMRPFAVSEEDRAAYHAAAAMASNLLVALEESAAELLARVDVGAPRELLAPLVVRTAANWAERGGAALTGPIARGDEATVERHRDAIADLAPELLALYDELAARARAIAAPADPAAERVA
jgi:predicted short-subunit dehydrogenase-like oxidoreductase (DUF2520 family)